MSRSVIVVGDRTSHGGVVITGSPFSDVDGKAIARIGDKVTCPKKGHGSVTTIVTGDVTDIIDGSPVARHGDMTACGAMLISSQMLTYVDAGGSTSVDGASNSDGKAANSAQPRSPSLVAEDRRDHIDEVIEQYFDLLGENGTPVDGYRYDLFEDEKIHTKAGALAGGQTAIVAGKSKLRLVTWLADDGATRA